MKYFLIFLILIGFSGFAFAIDEEITHSMISNEEHYEIEILGLKDEYTIGEEYSFYFVISGYGHSCANHQVSYPDEHGNIMHVGAEVLCAPEKSMHEFKINSLDQRGNLGNTGIKKTGTYTVTVTFEKPNKYYPTTVSKEFRVVGSIAENFNKLSPLKQIKLGIATDKIRCNEGLKFILKYDATPACIKFESIPKLAERGWISETDEHSFLALKKVSESCINDSPKQRMANPLRYSNGTHVFSSLGCEWKKIGIFVAESKTDFDISQTTTMEPNSMEYFYYPNPEDTKNRDAFQKFILIRLPESLGGGIDDVSAFRAYSAVSLSDHCLVKYWSDEGRQRMENPCRGGMYRAIDGLLMLNIDPVRVTSFPTALPRLDLSIDENGALYVEPPKWTLQENGVIGIGRTISMQEIRQHSQFLVDSYVKSYPNHPKIPAFFVGHSLSELHTGNDIEANYFDFSSTNDHVYFQIDNVSAQDQKYFLNFGYPNSEFWQIGDTAIRISGSALDKNNDQPEHFKQYNIQFILDGFKFTIEGKNLEFLKRGIIANYFPEHDYDDLFLVSSTVED